MLRKESDDDRIVLKGADHPATSNGEVDHLAEQWWPQHEEAETGLAERCARFRAQMTARRDWQRIAVVTHWGFIRGLTGLTVPNCAVLRINPHRPELEPEMLLMPTPPQR